MRTLLTASSIANEVGMVRASSRAAIALVEGDDDTRLFRRFVMPRPHAHLIPCRGKSTLLETMAIIQDRGTPGVLGVCDADFDRVTGVHYPSVIYTDHHDAEVMIAHSAAFLRVLDELVPAETLARFQGDPTVLRDVLLDHASQIGRIRLHCLQAGISIDFKAVDAGSFMSVEGFDLTRYISQALSVSPASIVSTQELIDATDGLTAFPVGELTQGHDLCAITDAISASPESPRRGAFGLGSILRLAFDSVCFRATDLASNIEAWEARTGFELLDSEACPTR
jgi:hypothetical protein